MKFRRNITVLITVLSVSMMFVAAKKNVIHEIDQEVCTQCGKCIKGCKENAIKVSVVDGKKRHTIDPDICTQCGDCIDACEEDAILILKKKTK